MSAVLKLVLGIMLCTGLVLMLSAASFRASPDTNKTQFQIYSNAKNLSSIDDENLTYNNTGNPVSNMESISLNMLQKIVEAQKDLNSDNPVDQVLGAFGLASALSIDLVFLFIAVPLDAFNFVAGILLNIASLDSPWREFGVLGGLVLALLVVYLAFKIAAMILKWDA